MSSSVLPALQAQLLRYGSFIPMIFGNIGNICIVLVFSRRRQNSCSMYLLCAAVVSSVYITFNTPITFYTLDYGDPTLNSLVLCKLRFYLTHVWGQISRSLVVLACIDRYVLTINNVRFQFISRPLVARSIVGIVIIFWHIVSIHILTQTTIINRQCGPAGVYRIVYYVYIAIFVCIIPSLLMAIFGFLAYRNMKRLHMRVQPVVNITDGNRGNMNLPHRDRDLLIMVFAEVAVFMVTTLPYPFISLEVAVTSYMGFSKSTERLQIESFLFILGAVILQIDHGLPFYTYFVVSKAFRKDVKEILMKWRPQVIGRFYTNANQRTG